MHLHSFAGRRFERPYDTKYHHESCSRIMLTVHFVATCTVLIGVYKHGVNSLGHVYFFTFCVLESVLWSTSAITAHIQPSYKIRAHTYVQLPLTNPISSDSRTVPHLTSVFIQSLLFYQPFITVVTTFVLYHFAFFDS